MAEIKDVPTIDVKDLNDLPLKFGAQDVDSQWALSLALNTFDKNSTYRTNYHDPLWNLNDMLYSSFVPKRMWPNTDIPRSDLGSGLVFEQVEGAYAVMMQALFSGPDSWALEADVGADPNAARAQQAHLQYAFERTLETRGSTPENEFGAVIKDVLMRGNGLAHVEFDGSLSMPTFYYVDSRDVYMDQFNPTPAVETARNVIWRRFMTMEDIRGFRNDPRMKVPDDAQLNGLAQKYVSNLADYTKQNQEAYRGINYNVQTASQTANPTQNNIEVLIYYDKFRIIWILGREWVMFNSRNPYGCIPFVSAPCYRMSGRYYAASVADVTRDPHRYVEALLNGRIDNITLMQFPPRAVPRGAMTTPAQQKWGPGSVFQMDDPKMLNYFQSPDMGTIFQEIDYIRSDTDRKTGIGAMLSGMPTPSNANRTAGGVAAQTQGSNLRMFPLVQNFENYFLIPLVKMAIKMVRVHMEYGASMPGKVYNAQKDENEYVRVSSQAFLANSRVRVRAATKMLTRDRLMQALPIIQNYINGPIISELNKVGKTFDFVVLTEMVSEATGIGHTWPWVRDYTEEEKKFKQEQEQQAAQQQTPEKIQLAQMDQQTRLEMGKMKAQSESEKTQAQLQIAATKGQKDPMEAYQKQQEMQAQMQMEQAKMQMELQKMQAKIEGEKQKANVDMMLAQMKLQAKQAEFEQKIKMQFQENQLAEQRMAQESAREEQMAQSQTALQYEQMGMEREHAAEMHKFKLNNIGKSSPSSGGGTKTK